LKATIFRTAESEKDFQQAIYDLARYYHWRVAHFRAGMDRRGRWSTPMQGDTGFPDIVLCRPGRAVYAEVKVEPLSKGKLTPEQRAWLVTLHEAGHEVFVWRPSYWWQVVDVLSGVYVTSRSDR